MKYEKYKAYRDIGLTASGAYEQHKKLEAEMEAAKALPTSEAILAIAMPIAMAIATAINKFKAFIDDARYGTLWITSRSGKTTVELGFFQALRVTRKRRWRIAKVEPVDMSGMIRRR